MTEKSKSIPTFLLTNDDGVHSVGLKASYDALKDVGETYIVAPAVQKSGVGRSISIMEPIRVSEITVDGMRAYAVDGTPTDSVIIGIFEILKNVPDVTICGINIGENISTESITTSGTVGAALEAATQESPAIAISLQVPDIHKFESFTKDFDFELSKEVLRDVVKTVLKKGMPPFTDVLNINIPSEYKGGFEVVKPARKLYIPKIEERLDPRGRKYYWIDGEEIDNEEPNTDISTLRKGKISITPLSLDSTAQIDFGELERWFNGFK